MTDKKRVKWLKLVGGLMFSAMGISGAVALGLLSENPESPIGAAFAYVAAVAFGVLVLGLPFYVIERLRLWWREDDAEPTPRWREQGWSTGDYSDPDAVAFHRWVRSNKR